MLRSFFFCGFLVLPLVCPALDAEKLASIRPAMEKAIQEKQAAGIVTLVIEKGKVVHHEATGYADLAAKRPMDKDAVFWIASMTKSVNATAVMMLVEEGKLSLDAPASQWLPELGKVKLADGSAPQKPITLRMLLSHTAGIAFPPRKATDGAISLKSYVSTLVKAPLAFQPGSDYEYGFGPTVAGHIVERVSGMKYEDFLQTRLFGPLGMKDTTFHPDEALRARLARTYKMDEDSGELVPGYNPYLTNDATVLRAAEPAGGLFSTAADMGRFYAMIAAGGELDGVRILSDKSIQDMTTPVRAGDRELPYASGWQLNPALPAGSFGHGGAFATNGWVHPASGIVTVYLVQNVLVPDSGKPKEAFQRLAYEAAGVKVQPPAAAQQKKGTRKQAK